MPERARRVAVLWVLLLAPVLLAVLFHSSQDLTGSAKAVHPSPDTAAASQSEWWEVLKIFPEEELIPGVGYRTTALLAQGQQIRKVYCLDPGKKIPKVGTLCVRKANGVYDCGSEYQRFRDVPPEVTPGPTATPTPTATLSPTPTLTPTPIPLDCTQLGLGLQVTYGRPPSSRTMGPEFIRSKPGWREFRLDPLAVAPDEIWENEPIRMVYPGKTCGQFTVTGVKGILPPEVVRVEVTIRCPGFRVDISPKAADGNYCFSCRDIRFSQKQCTVTNKLYIERDGQSFVCQGFYKVIDPPGSVVRSNSLERALTYSQP